MSSGVVAVTDRLGAFRAAVGRLARPERGELVPIMARREVFRILTGARSRQATALGLAVAAVLCLLIPLHRAYGPAGMRSAVPYFLIYGCLIQAGFLLLSGRAVWAGMRHDTASGSIEELLLTGARGTQVLLGKWLGLALAGILWTLMLVPLLLTAAAFTGAPASAVFRVAVSWAMTAALGAMLGALISLSERAPLALTMPFFGLFQLWIMLRALNRMGSGLGSWWHSFITWLRNADPLTLVPAAAGAVRDPWWFKITVLLLGMSAVALWMSGADREFAALNQRTLKKNPGDFFSLRPVRAWLASHRAERPADYSREVIFPFEWAYGWRFRVSLPMWICIFGMTLVPGVVAAIAGPALHDRVLPLVVLEVAAASIIGSLGMAASLSAEREQRRWVYLLCTPVSLEEIVGAKWRACCREAWPLGAGALVRGLLFGLTGLLPWGAVPVAVLAVPVAVGVSAAVTAALCATAASLTVAQQRAVVWLVLPVGLVLAGQWLLPGLTGPLYLSMPHVLLSALRFDPGFAGPLQALVAFLVYGVVGVISLKAAVWQLRRTL